jgi:hypothetical protein
MIKNIYDYIKKAKPYWFRLSHAIHMNQINHSPYFSSIIFFVCENWPARI